MKAPNLADVAKGMKNEMGRYVWLRSSKFIASSNLLLFNQLVMDG